LTRPDAADYDRERMTFQVILHQGVVDGATRARLEHALRRIGAGAHGGSEEVAVTISEVPTGRFFTAGKPSRSSLIATSVPAGTAGSERTALMSAITAMWCEVTGCTAEEVVVSAADG